MNNDDSISQKRQYELIQKLSAICEELGWIIGIPAEEGDESKVNGLIIGKEEFVYEIVEVFNGPQEYEIIEHDANGELIESKPEEPNKKSTKKKTYYH